MASGRFTTRIRNIPRRIGYRTGPRIMSAARRRWVLMRNWHADVQIDPTSYLGPGFSLDMPNGGTFICGPNCEFRRNFRAEISNNGRIVIGEGCYFTYDVVLQCSTSMEIGDQVGLGQAAIVLDASHRFRDITKNVRAQGYDPHPIKIGSHAFIPSKCTVLANVGERAMIGANAVITNPIPPYTVAVGIPAKVVDYFGPPGMEPEGWERVES
jgi:acetyltransferase-like isoleucine patch superfamily enzyme